MKNLDEEQTHHLIDLVQTRMTDILMNTREFDLLSQAQKVEAMEYDKNLITVLKAHLKTLEPLEEKENPNQGKLDV